MTQIKVKPPNFKEIILYPAKVMIDFFEKLGDYIKLLSKIFRSYKSWKYYLPQTIPHMFNIGVKSIPIVIITGLFALVNNSVAFINEETLASGSLSI